jgi:hypothetical protein
MLKANHTLGPWYKDGHEIKVSQPHRAHLGDGAPETICEMISSVSPEATEANAYLIAASPDLYRACRMLLLAYEGGEPEDSIDWQDLDDVVSAAQAAVDKAEGDIALDISTGKCVEKASVVITDRYKGD